MTTTKNDAPTRMLRKEEVLRRTGLSNVTLWRLERKGRFPRRRKLTGTAVGWRSDEVEEWIESRPPAELKDGDEER